MNRSSSSHAFSLVEIVVALGIASFGLVALLAMLPTGVNMVRESSSENVATNICTAIVSDLKNDIHSGETAQFHIPLTEPGNGNIFFDENGTAMGTSSDASSVYKLSWTVQAREGDTPPRVHLVVSWPATAIQPQGFVETLAILRLSPYLN